MCSSQTLSQDPSKVRFPDIQNPCKTEYGYLRRNYTNLRRNYANLRRNLGMWFLAFVYFFYSTCSILSGKHHGLLTTVLQQHTVTGLAKPL